MKFAQYLQDTLTPEWKRAYIDYRGLKKRITAIPRVQESSGDKFDYNEANPQNNGHQKASEDRPRSTLSAIPPADPTPRTEQEVGGAHLTRRRASTWTKPSSIPPQAVPSIRWSKGRPTLRRPAPLTPLPLRELMPELTSQEVAFFNYLDAQLEKVESFYSDREKELLTRSRLLQEQLRGLRDHRKLVHEASAYHETCLSAIATTLKLKLRSHPVLEIPNTNLLTDGDGEIRKTFSPKRKSPETRPSTGSTTSSTLHDPDNDEQKKSVHNTREDEKADIHRYSDPENYLYAKKKLKKAVLEHYRGLELLQNYRILNLTGFRKALKKFEKVTKIRAQEQYMTEKVDRGVLASDETLQAMMKEMQELYANAFLRGDSRKAMRRLRAGTRARHHHFSTFRSGILLGFAIPALVAGVYRSLLKETRDDIHAWDALLYLYGVLLVPVIYSLLVGLNLLVWARARVNYTFIFGLDLKTRMDYREYFEMPTFLFATLCYAFWLSFARIGSPHVSPKVWPLAWLGMVGATLFNPLPILSRPSRFWLLKIIARLFLPGTRRVEFADFWMGDQLCSLVFSLSSLSMFVCVYTEDFRDWSTCGSRSNYWPVAFVLAALPSLIRLIQSVKRYADSGLITHLINGGKYGFGILYYLFYYLWRQQKARFGAYFALWLVFATIYSSYASCWDLLMDWSLLRPRAKHFLLRDHLGYSNHVYLYYFAMVSNCLIRFAWVIYIPAQGPGMLVRSFIIGLLEMTRRVQWNFFRLENEHLGNMDQYRVTREVPLPYAFDVSPHDHDGDSSEPHSPFNEKN